MGLGKKEGMVFLRGGGGGWYPSAHYVTLETLEQAVKCRRHCGHSGVFIVNFEQVNAGWNTSKLLRVRFDPL